MKHTLERAAIVLALVYAADRLLKLAAVVHAFRRPPPAAPLAWPSLSLVQPITRSTGDLSRVLESRARLIYPGALQHVFICDAADERSRALCVGWLAAHPACCGALVIVAPGPAQLASKVNKLQAAVPHAQADVLCFVDDDVLLRPDALTVLVPYLSEPTVGAAFGLACYVDWHNTWSGLMSAFVNSNALLSYIPLTYLIDPFTLTGHCYALRRQVFTAIGGFEGMDAERVDDDHELARRVHAAGLRSRQTPLVYDVENSLASLRAYRAQMKRWFLFPRATLLPALPAAQRALAFGASAPGLLPPLLALLALLTRRARIFRALAATLALALAVYVFCETRYLRRRTPLHRLPLVLLSSLLAPLEIVAALFGGDDFEWRGRRLRMQPGGRAQADDSPSSTPSRARHETGRAQAPPP